MAVTRASLIAEYPEFTNADTALVTTKISHAYKFVDETIFGDQADLAVTLYACHLIAMSPYGMEMRLQDKNGETTYLKLFNKEAILTGASYRMG